MELEKLPSGKSQNFESQDFNTGGEPNQTKNFDKNLNSAIEKQEDNQSQKYQPIDIDKRQKIQKYKPKESTKTSKSDFNISSGVINDNNHNSNSYEYQDNNYNKVEKDKTEYEIKGPLFVEREHHVDNLSGKKPTKAKPSEKQEERNFKNFLITSHANLE
ncbi:hypothetical protein GVAV_003490 [Gurleya vavrai]